jgi:hypothetical protein
MYDVKDVIQDHPNSSFLLIMAIPALSRQEKLGCKMPPAVRAVRIGEFNSVLL